MSCMSSVSQMIPIDGRSNADSASYIGTSLSSTLSDPTAMMDDRMSGQYSPPVLERGSFEDDGTKLRMALDELSNVLGPETVRGTCHPCAERWAVLFVTSNGKGLSTQMTYDIDDEFDDESSLGDGDESESESDDDDGGPDLSKDYHQLRDSILKLVQDYEIPRTADSEHHAAPLTNRVSGLKKFRSKSRVIVAEGMSPTGSKHSYRHRKSREELDSSNASSAVGSEASIASMSSANDDAAAAASSSSAAGQNSEPDEPVLVTMLTAASTQSKAQADFVSAHLYWRTLQQLTRLDSPSLCDNGYAVLLNIFAKGPRDSIRHSAAAIEDYDAWLVWLKQSQERHEGTISRMMNKIKALRDKMWYVADVRVSKQYEHSRDICLALKSMGMTARRWGSYQRSRQSRGSAYMYRNESQIVDLLAASEAEGGPNKLSDDQADKTTRWLDHFGIENFCAGEERIHRFTCEVESCIGKLVGENIRDAPVLWSSDLFKRDKRILDAAKATRDRHHHHHHHNHRDMAWNDDTSSIVTDSERRFGSSRGSRGNGGRRALSPNAGSEISVDSGRHSIRRVTTSNLSDILDSSEYFGIASPQAPMAAMDSSSSTFWSPFHSTVSAASVVSGASAATSRAHSPTTSVTNLSHVHSQHSGLSRNSFAARSGAAAASAAASMATADPMQQHRLEEEKGKLLAALRQSLTSLLLSDLGNLVFARGSETDAWFDGLGQECIDRKDAADGKAATAAAAAKRGSKDKKSARDPPRPRVIEKKRSFTNLRDSGEGEAGGGESPEPPSVTAKRREKDKSPDEFPFKKAYQRLLNMFSVHPNPYTKLNALHELENLIMASQNLTVSRKGRSSGWSRTTTEDNNNNNNNNNNGGSSSSSNNNNSGNNNNNNNNNKQQPQSQTLGSEPPKGTNPLEGTIDSMKERRSQTLSLSQATPVSLPGTAAARMGSIDARTGPTPSTTEAITSILHSLFRDRSIRPKTLFRDLQLIAAFVPSTVLDKTDRGKAFWDTGLAALGLKLDVCRVMMAVAYEVIEASAGMGRPADPEPASAVYSLADAGRMYAITAREGFPTAQRELALFYLSNPELVERTTLPLSKPREVFKQAVIEKYGAGMGAATIGAAASSGLGRLGRVPSAYPDEDARGGDPRDPLLMCVAMHWMEAAAEGGDVEALTFLKQNASSG